MKLPNETNEQYAQRRAFWDGYYRQHGTSSEEIAAASQRAAEEMTPEELAEIHAWAEEVPQSAAARAHLRRNHDLRRRVHGRARAPGSGAPQAMAGGPAGLRAWWHRPIPYGWHKLLAFYAVVIVVLLVVLLTSNR